MTSLTSFLIPQAPRAVTVFPEFLSGSNTYGDFANYWSLFIAFHSLTKRELCLYVQQKLSACKHKLNEAKLSS